MSDRLEKAARASFAARIESEFNWRNILRALDSAEPYTPEGCDDDAQAVSVYLGSVFSLAPSGKYYTPFASGNVTPCAKCHGSGKSQRRDACALCAGKGSRVVLDGYSLDGLAAVLGHAVEVGDTFQCNGCAGLGSVPRDCYHCGGIGSREAWLDSIFWETLDAKAEALGCYVENGSGDACDVFISRAVETDDAGEDHDDGAPARVEDHAPDSLDAAA